jgi:hypothetical protein
MPQPEKIRTRVLAFSLIPDPRRHHIGITVHIPGRQHRHQRVDSQGYITDYSTTQICQLLWNAGFVTSNNLSAAAWLITGTALPADPEFCSSLTFFTGSYAGKAYQCAIPARWPEPSSRDDRDSRALLQFAHCLATGGTLGFRMPDLLTGLCTETVQRIAEAMIVASGKMPWLHVAEVDLKKGR